MFCVMNEVALVFFTTCRSAHNEMHQQKQQHVKTIGSLHQHGQDAMVPNDGFIVVYALDEQTCMLIAKQIDTKILCMLMKFIVAI